MSFTDTFATPDDPGDLHASELSSSLGEQLGAEAGEAFMGGTRQLLRGAEFSAAQGNMPDFGGPVPPELYQTFDPSTVPTTPIAAAKARVKQEGLEGQLDLPDQDSIRTPVLDLMIRDARERAQYAAAVNRGPQNFAAGALGFLTSIGAGMIDPVNAAAFSIPVLGEARYGMLLARAGDSLAARAALRTGVGAAQGAVGGAALVPADWWLHTQDGQDYTFADALKSVVLSAGMGAAAHGGFGAIGDLAARLRGKPLSGSIEDLRARALAGDTHAADIVEQLGAAGVHLPEQALEPGGVETDQVPGVSSGLANIDQQISESAAPATDRQAALAAYMRTEPGTEESVAALAAYERAAETPTHPAEVLADLPPAAREDVTRAAIAGIINGEPVRAGEMLAEAAKDDPRIAESVNLKPQAAEGEAVRPSGTAALPAIDNSHDVVSGANSAKDPDGPVYVDQRIPQFSPKLKDKDGNPANLHKYLAVHETEERAGMARAIAAFKQEYGREPKAAELDRIYNNVHTNIATPAERAAVEADGVDWKGYTDEIDGYLSKIEHEKAANPPPEPLHVDPDAAIGHHQSSNKKEPAGAPALPVARARPAKAKAPQSLLQFLAEKGGISDKDPLAPDLLQSFGGKNPTVPGYGKLLRPGGKPLDRAREAAVEAGYLHDEGLQHGGVTESTINHLLEAIDAEARGTRQYPAGSEGFRSKEELQAQDEENRAARETYVAGAHADIERLMDEWGVTSLRKFIGRKAFDTMDSEGVDAETALERAVSDFAMGGRDILGDGGRADWISLKREPQRDDEIADASRDADKAPAPPETPERAVSAAQKAAADADKLLADILPTLSDDERKTFEDALSELEHDTEAREQIVRDGAACLAAASAEAA